MQTALTDPVRLAVESLDSRQVNEVRSTLVQVLEPFETTGAGFSLPTEVVTAVATA